jgi:hypothetical protein
MEFILFCVLTFLAIETIIFGVKLFNKEGGFKRFITGLSKRVEGDMKTLADEAEEWLKGKFNKKEGG